VVVRSKLVNPGYHANPEATAGSRRDGWHCTGDLGYFDADGYLYLVDRKKDVVITGGFNVYSAEVEAALMELDGMKECVVVGMPDRKWGERVTAAVVPRPGRALTAGEVIAHCKARLGSVKAPKAVHFFAELPKTPVGKYDKKHVREMCSSRNAGASMA
jgi:acyl-CoA synthetase (AMP-forming)/AMP-acid ligase II